MQHSKLIQVLKVLSKKELAQLQLFIHDKFFNNKKKQYAINCKLFDYIIQYAPNFENEKLSKSVAYAYLFPTQAYKDQEIRYVLSNVFKLVEQFLVWKVVTEQPKEQKLTLLAFYEEHNLDKHFEATRRNLLTLQQKTSIHDSNYFYTNFKIAEKSTAFLSTRKKAKPNAGIQELIYELDTFYLTQLLIYSCEIVNRSKILGNQQYDLPLNDAILQGLPNTNYLKNPTISIYYVTLQMLQNLTDTTLYFEVKKQLRQHIDKLPIAEAKNLYTYAHNYCIWQGKQAYVKELLSLYEMQLAQGLLFKNGYIALPIFKNIVTLGLIINDLKWTANFITTNLDKVEKKYQREVYHYNYAHLCFYEKKYQEAVDLLIEQEEQGKEVVLKFEDVFYQIAARKLLIQTYFELDSDKIEDMFNNLEVFLSLNRQVLSKRDITMNRNFIKILKQLYKLPLDKRTRRKKLASIQENMTKTKVLAQRKWLVSKVKELSA